MTNNNAIMEQLARIMTEGNGISRVMDDGEFRDIFFRATKTGYHEVEIILYTSRFDDTESDWQEKFGRGYIYTFRYERAIWKVNTKDSDYSPFKIVEAKHKEGEQETLDLLNTATGFKFNDINEYDYLLECVSCFAKEESTSTGYEGYNYAHYNLD